MGEVLDQRLRFGRALGAAILPRAPLGVAEWADRHRILSGKAASEPGPWRTARTPYLREPLNDLSVDSDVEEIVLWFATQTGKSECCNNWVGYTIDYDPGPMLLVQPTLDLAKRYSKQRIASLIESSPALRGKVQPARARDSGNTLTEKEFDGGILIITGANSATGLRSMPARNLMFDEIDGYPLSIDEEGDPISIAEKRQDTFSRRKRLKTSTCTIKHESRIEQAYEASDRRRYWVPCPHCSEMQVLTFKQLKWVDDDPQTARYCCEHCGALIEETAKTEMLERGAWRAEVPNARVHGYWLNGLYSPLGWVSWATIVREWLEAKVLADSGDQTKMQVWVNTRAAETWEMLGTAASETDVQARAEDYELRTVPRGVLLTTAAVDVQGDRLELQILGWGVGEECWVLDYQKLYGDPGEAVVWEQLDAILKQPLRNAFHVELRLGCVAIDHGGHHAKAVETFTRPRAGRHVIAIKGQSQKDKPILGVPRERDTSWKGKKVRRGARVWPVGSDEGKKELYERLRLTKPGPRYIHTSTELDDAYYLALTAEQKVTRYVRGKARSEWELKKGRRNEALDLWVYGYAAAHYCGMQRFRAHDWKRLRERVEPAPAPIETDELEGVAAAPAPQVTAEPRRPGRLGAIGGLSRFGWGR